MTTTPAAQDVAAGQAKVPWLAVMVLAAACFLALTVELSPAGLLNRMAPDLHAGVAATGMLTALYSVGNAVLALPLTAVAVRISRRVSLTVTLLAFVVGNVVVAVSDSLGPALAGRFVAGAAHGLLMSLAPAVAVGVVGPTRERHALSLIIGANTLGIALGAPLASFVGITVGWRSAFLLAALFALVCAVLLAVSIPPLRTQDSTSLSLIETAREPGVLRIGFGWMALMLAYMGVLTYVDPYLETLGAPPLITSLSLFVFGVGGIAGVWIGGRITARSRMAALIAAPALMAVSFALLALGIASVPLVLVLLVTWGVGFTGMILVWQETLLLVGHRAPEMSMGIGVVLTQIGMAVGAACSGLVVDRFGVTSTPLVGVAFTFLGLLALVGAAPVLRRADADRRAARAGSGSAG